jgi:uncharacterized protein (DUF1697 family)
MTQLVSTRHIALLRGINVGGKNKISMIDLKRLFGEAGAENVSTFIQSGNVLFDLEPSRLHEFEQRAMALIDAHLGKPIPLVFRSGASFQLALTENPFLTESESVDNLFVMFLQSLPSAEQIAVLDPNRSPGDEFQVAGQNVYLRLVTGAADTKLTNAYFDSKLKTVSTIRNWRTVQELARLLKQF